MLVKIILSAIMIGMIVFSFRQGFKIGAEEGMKRGAFTITCHPAFQINKMNKVGKQ